MRAPDPLLRCYGTKTLSNEQLGQYGVPMLWLSFVVQNKRGVVRAVVKDALTNVKER